VVLQHKEREKPAAKDNEKAAFAELERGFKCWPKSPIHEGFMQVIASL
jgi:hypothetical protein